MIDVLYAKFSHMRERPLDPNFKPSDSISGKTLLNEKSDRLVVIFPGWHTHKFPVNRLSQRLAKKGWAVLTYDFHDQILVPSDEIVKQSFGYIRDQIGKDIADLTAKNGYQQVRFTGISLGNVAMALVSESFNKFDSAIFVVGGEDLAEDMWHGYRTLFLRDEFKKAHIGLRKLDQDWHDEAPMNHARRFNDKKVKFVMSRSDKFILPKYQRRLIEDLRAAGAEVDVSVRYVGHLMTIMRFCLIDRPT